MSDALQSHFYVTIRNKEKTIVGHIVSPNPPPCDAHDEGVSTPKDSASEETVLSTPSVNFASVAHTFASVMESYRRFITLTLNIGPQLSSLMASARITKFVKEKGSEILELSTDTRTVYRLPITCYHEFHVHQEEITALVKGAEHLPEIAVIGLVSSYDAFLTELLRVVLTTYPNLVLTSEKTLKFSELCSFASIEDARATLIDREIESVIRLSHHEQFEWMERRFAMTLRTELPVWPRFVELCERRNLMTHTGGAVSAQYLANCGAHGADTTGVAIGDRLSVSSQYFSEAVTIIYELGVKLCHVLWRKFAPAQREEADRVLSELCYNLIYGGAYRLAEVLLRFGTSGLKVHSSDRIRRVMVVNLANSLRLQEKQDEAKEVLDEEDWSAVDNEFSVCVAAVRGDIAEVVRLMPIIGTGSAPNAEAYRAWPVFRGMGSDERFTMAFEKVFGEPYVKPRVEPATVAIGAPDEAADEDGEESGSSQKLPH